MFFQRAQSDVQTTNAHRQTARALLSEGIQTAKALNLAVANDCIPTQYVIEATFLLHNMATMFYFTLSRTYTYLRG